MKAMILAAGRGERMRPLTDRVPKPLLEIGGKPLIVWHVEKLRAAGFIELVINCSHLGDQIEAALGDGARFGARISYTREAQPLETAGGIAYALHLLGTAPFAVVNADIYSDYPYERLAAAVAELVASDALAHLVLVDNPQHHRDGDFALVGRRVVCTGLRLTFSGIAVYRPEFFAQLVPGTRAALAPLLRAEIERARVTGEHYRGCWYDIGTPERLALVNAQFAAYAGPGAGL